MKSVSPGRTPIVGGVVELSVTGEGTLSELRLVPTEIHDYAVHEARGDAAAWSRERMRDLSASFGTSFECDGSYLVLELDD